MAARVGRIEQRKPTDDFGVPLYKSSSLGEYQAVPITDLHDLDVLLDDDKPKDSQDLLASVVFSTAFQSIMALLIVGNSLVIGAEIDLPEFPHWDLIEQLFLLLFSLELFLRLAVLKLSFFDMNGADFSWNLFDLAVITVGILDFFFALLLKNTGSAGSTATLFRIIRLLRILRIFRIVRFLKQLYLLAYGMAEACQAVFWVTCLMAFILYVCSIVIVRAVGKTHEGEPYHEFLTDRFGTIVRSMLTLFELMAAPNLPDYQAQGALLYEKPLLAAFLISFIIFGSFGMIALLTGVISESMFEKNQLRLEEDRQERERQRLEIRQRCEKLFSSLDVSSDGRARKDDVMKLIPQIEKMFEAAHVEYTVEDVARAISLRVDSVGAISQAAFLDAMLALARGVRSIALLELHSAVNRLEDMTEGIILTLNGYVWCDRKPQAPESWSWVKPACDADEPRKEEAVWPEQASDRYMGQGHNTTDSALEGLKAGAAAQVSVLEGLKEVTSQVASSVARQHTELERLSDTMAAWERRLALDVNSRVVESTAAKLTELRQACESMGSLTYKLLGANGIHDAAMVSSPCLAATTAWPDDRAGLIHLQQQPPDPLASPSREALAKAKQLIDVAGAVGGERGVRPPGDVNGIGAIALPACDEVITAAAAALEAKRGGEVARLGGEGGGGGAVQVSNLRSAESIGEIMSAAEMLLKDLVVELAQQVTKETAARTS